MHADAISHIPRDPPPQCGIGQDEFQVAVMRSDEDLSTTLEADPVQTSEEATDYAAEQHKDDELKVVIDFLSEGHLPGDIAREPRLWLPRKHSSRWSMESSTMLIPRVTTGRE